MYTIFADETGTSSEEQVAVIAAAIVRSGDQEMAARQSLLQLHHENIPGVVEGGFYPLSAKELKGGNVKNSAVHREKISLETHERLWQGMLGLPRKHSIPLAIGAVDKVFENTEWKQNDLNVMGHFLTFAHVLGPVDLFMRMMNPESEEGIIVLEDGSTVKNPVLSAAKGLLSPKRDAKYGGTNRTSPKIVTKKKTDEVLLQLADFSGYVIRRFLEAPTEKNEADVRYVFGDGSLDALHLGAGGTQLLVTWNQDGMPKFHPYGTPVMGVLEIITGKKLSDLKPSAGIEIAIQNLRLMKPTDPKHADRIRVKIAQLEKRLALNTPAKSPPPSA